MSSRRKKPTNMEMKDALTNLIVQQQQLTEAFRRLDFIVGKYIDFKSDEKSFRDFLEKFNEEAKKKEKDGK